MSITLVDLIPLAPLLPTRLTGLRRDHFANAVPCMGGLTAAATGGS